jgi:transposase
MEVICVYLIGIDISKYKHDCFIATETGEIIKEAFSFDNNKQGFTQLLEVLSSLDSTQTKRIGLEATGHYGYNLKVFLDQHGFTFMEFNPYLVKRYTTSLTLRKTKTDKIDSKLLSMILLSVEYKIYPVKSYHIQDLKSLTRYYKTLVKKRSKEIVSITNILDCIFPEFKPFFKNKLTKTAIYILINYQTPSKIATINSKSCEKLNSISRGKFSYAKFLKFKDLAKNTIGSSSLILNSQLQSTLRIYTALDNEIAKLEKSLTKEANQLHSPVFTIKGIGDISALSIISEYNNFTTFNSPAAMLSFAGLEPSVIQSGTINKTGKMVKRGSGYLRETIMNVAIPFAIHNPTIYDFYIKKRKEGKVHRVALTHVAKKLIRIIFYLVKNENDFDQSKLR